MDDPADPSDLTTGTVTGKYAYDSMGQRFLVHEPHKTTHLIRTHSGGKVVNQWQDGLATPERYHFAGGRLHALDTGVELGFYHHDARGDVLGLSDANATLVGQHTIDVWGKRTPAFQDTSTLSGQRFGFTGHEHDANGLVHMQARCYNPTLGTFITEDPAPGSMLDPRSRLKHVYAHHDPVNRWDPDGRSTRFIGQHGNSGGSLGVTTGSFEGGINYSGFDFTSHNAFQGSFSAAASSSRFAEINLYNQMIAAELDSMGTEIFLQQTTAIFNYVPLVGTMAGNFVRGQMKRQMRLLQGHDVSNYEYTDGLFDGTILDSYSQWSEGSMGNLAFFEQALGAVLAGAALSGAAASSLRGMRRNRRNAAVINAARVKRSVASRTHKTPANNTAKSNGVATPKKPKPKEKHEPIKEHVATSCPIPPAKSVKGNSFEEGTEVLMCDGSLKAIDEIEKNEWVVAKDPETGKIACKRVLHTMSHLDDDLVTVTVGDSTIRTTWHHPFIDDDGESFRVFAQRGRGGEVGTFSTLGGQALAFARALEHDEPVRVFNIDVEGFDSYFVGREGVWSHNSNQDCPTGLEDHNTTQQEGTNRVPPGGPVNPNGLTGICYKCVGAFIENIENDSHSPKSRYFSNIHSRDHNGSNLWPDFEQTDGFRDKPRNFKNTTDYLSRMTGHSFDRVVDNPSGSGVNMQTGLKQINSAGEGVYLLYMGRNDRSSGGVHSRQHVVILEVSNNGNKRVIDPQLGTLDPSDSSKWSISAEKWSTYREETLSKFYTEVGLYKIDL